MEMKLVLMVCVSLMAFPNEIHGELYTASYDLQTAFQLERQVVNVLGEMVSKAEAKINAIRKYLKDYESVVEEKTSSDDEFMERVAGNPIHAYRLMKRLTIDWNAIENEIKMDDWKDALKRLERVRMGSKFPKEEDFHGAAQALIRLQDTYELNMTELVRGNLWGRQTRAELTAQDCLFMGKHSFNAGIYARAIEWFQEAYVLAGLENNRTVRQDQVMDFIEHTIKLHDASLEQGPSTSERTFMRPLHEKPAHEQRQQMIRNRKYNLGKHIGPLDDAANFNALCRGEQLLSPQIQAKLKCWTDSRKQPFLYLQPIKVEQNSFNPPIYTFHQVLSDSEIDTIKSLSSSLLSRSMVQGTTAHGHQVSNVRTSKTAWLSEHLHPLMPKISRRIRLITGLRTDPFSDEAELLQVANYGIGGHYNPHHDYLMKDKADSELERMPQKQIDMGDRVATFMFYLRKMQVSAREFSAGDRIATFMFYMNDVERGGRTAFPRAGVAVKPVKGGAAFWYNLKRSGKPDVLTLHGACPVLLGHKWVSNKWIRETAQTFTRPCLLDMNE